MTRDEIIPPTPEWFAQNKGQYDIDRDAQGRFLGAARKDDSVLAWLIQKEILDANHAYCAMVLADMRHYFRRRVDYRPNSMYALEFFGGSSTLDLETAYLRVCRRIMGKTETLVAFANESHATQSVKDTAWPKRYAILAAFDKLARDIHEVREEMRKEEEERQKGRKA